jgi:predicted RNA-binding Zn ribbon-like protein
MTAGPRAIAAPPDAEFSFVGNLLCLDFVNTEVMRQGGRLDRLPGIDDLLRWAREAELVDDAALRTLPPGWRTSREAARFLEDAKALRALLRAMAEALDARRALPTELVPAINHALAAGASTLRLERRGDAYAAVRVVLDPSPAALLAPIAESAAWLLEHGDRSLVRRCENDACIRFFYDTTKNRRRRWCAMDACGSRAKAAAYYRRRKSADASAKKASAGR